jgi:hypothetical protein
MKKPFTRIAAATLFYATLCAPLQAHAGFNGQTVGLGYYLNTITGDTFNTLATTVGAGAEFIGTGTDSFGQQWNFSIDITDNSINYSWNESTRAGEPNGGNISSAPDSWSFDLTFSAASVPAMTLTGFNSSGLYSPQTSSLTHLNNPTANQIHAGFSRLDATDSYTVTAVPEPETYALLLAGLGLMGGIARRKKA